MTHQSFLGLLAVGVFAVAGCDKGDAPPTVSEVSPEFTGASEHSVVELFEPVVRFDAEDKDLVQLEVKYRFTKGQSLHHYMMHVQFPGTKNVGSKPMEGWEMEETGVIRDGFSLHDLPVREFEIRLEEAFSPQAGYTLISNRITGTVEGQPAKASEEQPAEVSEGQAAKTSDAKGP